MGVLRKAFWCISLYLLCGLVVGLFWGFFDECNGYPGFDASGIIMVLYFDALGITEWIIDPAIIT